MIVAGPRGGRRASARVASLVAAAAIVASCASPIAPPAPHAGAPRRSPALDIGVPSEHGVTTSSATTGDSVLARVGGREVTVSELLSSIRQRDAQLLGFHLNLLVGERLAEIEAQRIGLEIAQQDVDDRARTHEAAFVAQLQGSSLDTVLRDELGVDPAAFRTRLARDARRELLTERVVRTFTLAQETARVRILVAPDDVLDRVRERFAAGEDFGALASELSRDPTGRDGGLVPYVVRSERSRLARLAFRTDVGTLGGPIDVGEDGLKLLLLVEAVRQPVLGDWSTVRGAVESSLADHEVTEEEYLQWQLVAERAVPVDLSPISQLIGENLR
ncbi:MAG: peptidylprolyl isomerase [Planctomycetota bacterium]